MTYLEILGAKLGSRRYARDLIESEDFDVTTQRWWSLPDEPIESAAQGGDACAPITEKDDRK